MELDLSKEKQESTQTAITEGTQAEKKPEAETVQEAP